MCIIIIIKEKDAVNLRVVVGTGGVGKMLPWKRWVGEREGGKWYNSISIKNTLKIENTFCIHFLLNKDCGN